MTSTEAVGNNPFFFTTVTENISRPTRFWLSLNVPDRENYKKKITKHGGDVVLLERHADIKLVDHLKKNIPPGCLTYKYVDHSIKNGRVPQGQDLKHYQVAPSAPRPMGASHIPKKGTRTDFSLEDDQILYDWLHPAEKVVGAPINGNKIYQELEKRFPQHSWQAWRGRYLRRLRGKPRPGGGTPRPDLLYGPAPEPNTEHPQQHPMTTAPSRTEDASPQVSGSSDPNGKRKRHLSPQIPELPAEATASSPSKRRKPEIHTASTPIVQKSHVDPPPSPPRTSNAPTLPQVIPHTRPSHTTIPSTQSSPHTEPVQIPVLESSDDGPDPLFLELPYLPPSPEPDDSEESDEDLPDVGGWIAMQLERGIADEATIIAVLRSTTMDQDLADKVLENWDPSTAIPDNVRGVWTAEDDKCLEATDGRDVERAITKHGEEFTNIRWEYLRMAREKGLL